jgi:hypothetical protein
VVSLEKTRSPSRELQHRVPGFYAFSTADTGLTPPLIKAGIVSWSKPARVGYPKRPTASRSKRSSLSSCKLWPFYRRDRLYTGVPRIPGFRGFRGLSRGSTYARGV